jgi:hypothetical protein
MTVTRERPLSRTQIRMLKNIRDGLSPTAHCNGMSEFGGADGTWRSLVRRGLAAWEKNDLVITALGRGTLRDLTKVDA